MHKRIARLIVLAATVALTACGGPENNGDNLAAVDADVGALENAADRIEQQADNQVDEATAALENQGAMAAPTEAAENKAEADAAQ